MPAHRTHAQRRATRRLLLGIAIGATSVLATAAPASAAVTASFANGVLNVNGDALGNNIAVSRNAAGQLLVNGGAVAVVGGTPTVANTASIRVHGLGGADTLSLSEVNGALPQAFLFGGSANDVLTSGSGNDQLFGEGGNDTLLGKGGFDFLFGGSENDTLTGGDADDQVFGQGGNDRMIWNPGDDTDLNEGAGGTDTVEVNGGNGTEQFTTTANGTRVRFDRLNPAPFAIDIGTSENLVLNANGGDDSFSATGNLAALIKLTIDGGTGNDSLLGSNGVDVLIAGDGNDFVDGQQGNDTGFLGAGNDVFQWDPGDANDVVEGQDGSDTLRFNGSNGSEQFQASANGGRVRFTRNLANVVMDTNDVEAIDVNALGGSDLITVNDLSGTDLVAVNAALAAAIGGTAGDLAVDNVVVTGTNGDDVAIVAGNASGVSVLGLAARVDVTGAEAALDRLTVNALAGDDVVDASGVAAGSIALSLTGGEGDDVVIGGDGNDNLVGGAGDDVLIGGPGVDTLDGGGDDDVVIQLVGGDTATSATAADTAWLAAHTRIAGRKTVVEAGGEEHTLPRADLRAMIAAATPA
jgi:Ca2+-binding RTX toxin-like protein